MTRWPGTKSGLGRLGIILLILGVGRIPLPVPDYHAGGQVEAHEPGHDSRCGRPTIHWHWVVLNTSALCEASSAGAESPDCHPDWTACPHDASPQYLATRSPGRAAIAFVPSKPDDQPPPLDGWPWDPSGPAPARRPRSFGATYPPRTSTASLLQRWTC